MGDDTLAEIALVDFEIGVGVVSAEAVELCLYEVFLVDVFAFFVVFPDPEVWVHFADLQRHQSCKDGIAGVLCGSGEDGEVLLLVGDGEEIGEEGLYGFPLVVSEIVDDDEEEFVSVVEHGEEYAFEDVGGHEGSLVRVGEPVFVVALYKLGEGCFRLCALHVEQFAHGRVHIAQVDVPFGEGSFDSHPLLQGLCGIDHISDVSEFPAVGLVGMFAEYFPVVDMFFEAEEYLAWVDGFDEVVGYFLSDSLFHDAFLLAFCNHDNGEFGVQAFDFLQCFESGQSGHILVEEDDVERFGAAYINSVLPVVGGEDFVVSASQVDDIGFEEVNFIVRPKYSIGVCHIIQFYRSRLQKPYRAGFVNGLYSPSIAR